MMRRCRKFRLFLSVTTLAVVFLGAPSMSWAQEVHGRIWDGTKKRDLSGAQVFADCAKSPLSPAKTDSNGLYRIAVKKAKVDCNVWVIVGSATSSRARVYLFKSRTRVDLELRKSGGKLVLVRR